MTKHTQNGNALWLILLAIVLIGGLTAMFLRSSNTSDDTGDYEKNSIKASQILRYAKSVELGVQNLISRGCSENTLSFWYDSNGDGVENSSDDDYTNKAPTDRSCHLFDPAGAGLTHETPPPFALSNPYGMAGKYYLLVGNAWDGNGTTCANASCGEVLLNLVVDKTTCEAINKQAGISGMPEDTNGPWGGFVGGNPAAITSVDIVATNPGAAMIAGKTAACVFHGSDIYLLHYVLLSR